MNRSLPHYLISIADAAIVILAVWLAYLLRFNFAIPASEIAEIPMVLGSITVVRVLLLLTTRSYIGIDRHEGLTDTFKFILILILGSFIFILADFISYYLVNQRLFIPLTIIILEFLLTTVLLLFFRSLINGGRAGIDIKSASGKNVKVLDFPLPPAFCATVAGKRILITGTGSNMGREMTALLIRCRPAELILADADEQTLEKPELLKAGYPGVKITVCRLEMADIKGLEELVALHNPHLVIHAGRSSPENNLDKARKIILQSGKSMDQPVH
ncbi:MAG: polysaccharide biosynthesis protein [Bacteroidota bacterium]